MFIELAVMEEKFVTVFMGFLFCIFSFSSHRQSLFVSVVSVTLKSEFLPWCANPKRLDLTALVQTHLRFGGCMSSLTKQLDA